MAHGLTALLVYGTWPYGLLGILWHGALRTIRYIMARGLTALIVYMARGLTGLIVYMARGLTDYKVYTWPYGL